MSLTEEQSKFVVAAVDGADVLGIARAGTGKTTTGREVCNALRPTRVLYLAFAKVNATDIQAKAPANTDARTTHSYGYAVCTRNTKGAKYDKFKTANLCQRALPRGASRDSQNSLAHLVSMGKAYLSTSVDQMVDLAVAYNDLPPVNDKTLESARIGPKEWAQTALAVMKACREDTRSVDFDDMIYLPAVHDFSHEHYGLVILDEAQDITPAQRAIVTKARGKNGRVMTIGDDRQAIYGWRGADPRAMFDIAKQFNSKTLKITATFRCGRAIVEDAKRFVPDYVGAAAHDGEVINTNEAGLLAGVRPGDAILSRVNAPLAKLCLQLLRNNVRASIRGKDIGAGLSKLLRMSNATSLPELATWLSGYREREYLRLVALKREDEIESIDDRIETISALSDGCANVEDLEARFSSLFDDKDEGDHQDLNRVLLSSTHRAKGLEWDNVFMLEDTYRPKADDDGDTTGVCEENNLIYVAITRAKHKLHHVHGIGGKKPRK